MFAPHCRLCFRLETLLPTLPRRPRNLHPEDTLSMIAYLIPRLMSC
jgi:hypothetical protein